ncbi:MAG: D-inositol-3-phosphate glycosyltransferase, partial [Nocardioides sp.]
GGLTTVVRDGISGLLVDGHDAGAWASALERIVADDALRDRLAAGALEHAGGFSWDLTADRTLDVYQRARATMPALV